MNFLFSFQGRIGRLQWWLGQLAVIFGLISIFKIIINSGNAYINDLSKMLVLKENIFFLEEGELNTNFIIFIIIILVLSTWINTALTVKRFHDHNKSGLWWFIILIPYIGSIWQLIECGFLAGTVGTNEYNALKKYQSNWSQNEYNEETRETSNIDEVITQRIAERKYQSITTANTIKPTNNNKPAFGKRT